MVESICSYITAHPKVIKCAEYNPVKEEWAHIEAITYESAPFKGEKTKVFAYIGFPKQMTSDEKVPAVVLVHGGGGHAYAEWVRRWNEKGYAAIAMDTVGCFPSESGKGKAGVEGEDPNYWQHGLYGPFSQEGYTSAPFMTNLRNDATTYSEPENHWMYHAIVATIMAHNILKLDSRVDVDKIGITGISWGAVISSLAIGYDTRYAYAVPVYGCGYLDESLTYFRGPFSADEVKALWSAADGFDRVTFPTLWLAWAFDPAFSINTNSKSYLAVKKAGGLFRINPDWGHSHAGGWGPAEIYRFSDAVCRGGNGLVACVTEPSGQNISFEIKTPEDAVDVTATAYYIAGKLSYSSKDGADPTADQTAEDWKTVPCTVEGNMVRGKLPSEAVNYYVEITLHTPEGAYVTSSSLVEIG